MSSQRDSRPGAIHLTDTSCGNCELGRASGAGQGQFCPFIIRSYDRDEVLCMAGEPADHVWFVKDGLIGLTRSRDDADRPDVLRLPGGYVGLEGLVGDRYVFTARALARSSVCGATREGFAGWLRQSDERVAMVMRVVLEDLIGRPGLGGGPGSAEA